MASPKIILSVAAQEALRAALEAEAECDCILLEIDQNYTCNLQLANTKELGPTLSTYLLHALPTALSPDSLRRAEGMSIDFVNDETGVGFKIINPKAPPRISELSPKACQEMLAREFSGQFVDVRSPSEREICALPQSRILDQCYFSELKKLAKDTPIIFYCHHGVRSRHAAEEFLALGFTKLYNLSGGIDAYSRQVDPQIPRY